MRDEMSMAQHTHTHTHSSSTRQEAGRHIERERDTESGREGERKSAPAIRLVIKRN